MSDTSLPPSRHDSNDGSHLSQIKTESLVRRWVSNAQPLDDDLVIAARQRFLALYHAPVYAYIRRLLRDAAATDDVYQDFAMRVLKRSFRGYSADRGRFRDYLKTTLCNMVFDHRRKMARAERGVAQDFDLRNLQEQGLSDLDAALSADDTELENLIETTFAKLRAVKQRSRPTFYDALTYVSRHSDETYEAAADALTRTLGLDPPLKAPALRQLVKRGRDKFRELFLEEMGIPDGPGRLEEINRRLGEWNIQRFFPEFRRL